MSIPVLGVGVGPQMNKFEQVSSVDHQMSVAGEVGPQVWCQGVGLQVTYPMMHVMYLSPCGQADTCENITFLQLLLQVVTSIPVGRILPICQPYIFWWPPLNVSTSEVGRSSSEQVWTGLQWWPPDVSTRGGKSRDLMSGGGRSRSPGLMSRGGRVVPRSNVRGRGVGLLVWCPGEGVGPQVWCLGGGVIYPMMHVMYKQKLHWTPLFHMLVFMCQFFIGHPLVKGAEERIKNFVISRYRIFTGRNEVAAR